MVFSIFRRADAATGRYMVMRIFRVLLEFFFLFSAEKPELKDFSVGKSKSGGKSHAQPRV